MLRYRTSGISPCSDTYKISHWDQYQPDTEQVHSYFECRKGAAYPEAMFYGLNYILKRHFVGPRINKDVIDRAEYFHKVRFGNKGVFNRKGWENIVDKFGGNLPLKIRAVPEGTVVPINNILISVENTDKLSEITSHWLTNYSETRLSNIWGTINVATISYTIKKMLKEALETTGCPTTMLEYMLHDFGDRGTTCEEQSGLLGSAHLLNFRGTDADVAIDYAIDWYNAELNDFANGAVVATEHSTMTSLGPYGEHVIVEQLLNKNPSGILSVVADSYDIEHFVEQFVCYKFKERIKKRDGIFVIRPDSLRSNDDTPGNQVVWIMQALYDNGFANGETPRGYKLISDKVKVLWGDGLNVAKIQEIIDEVKAAGFAISNIATLGMGGGLLQKHDRDLMRCAFKCSEQTRNGEVFDIYKKPKDASKASKKGRQKLVRENGAFKTVKASVPGKDYLEDVFVNGELVRDQSFSEIREIAAQFV